MTLADETRPEEITSARTLAARRPGHAVMTKVLTEVGPAAWTQVAAQMPVASRSWYDGAIGELIVGHELAQLHSNWRVLHAIPVGRNGRDIDHLVIGPGGIFVLNTKRHLEARIRAGTHVTWVREFKQPYQVDIAQVAGEVARALSAALPSDLAPQPVLVFVQCQDLSQVGEQRVAALQSHNLVTYLRSRPALLSDDQVRSIAALAERPGTWGAPPAVLDEPDPTVQFLGLRPPVGQPVTTRPAPARSSLPLTTTRSAPHPRRATKQPVKRSRASRSASDVLLRLIGAALIIPISIGILEAVLQVWTALLTSH